MYNIDTLQNNSLLIRESEKNFILIGKSFFMTWKCNKLKLSWSFFVRVLKLKFQQKKSIFNYYSLVFFEDVKQNKGVIITM